MTHHARLPQSRCRTFHQKKARPWFGDSLITGASFVSELTHAGYKVVPVSYLLCEDDLCIPAATQTAGIEMIEKESGNKVYITRIKADHCPNFSARQQMVDWILDVAGRAKGNQVVA